MCIYRLKKCIYFLRDDLCRGGDLLHSPALSYTLHHLAAAVEVTRQNKLIQEQPDDETETRSSDDSIKVLLNDYNIITFLDYFFNE